MGSPDRLAEQRSAGREEAGRTAGREAGKAADTEAVEREGPGKEEARRWVASRAVGMVVVQDVEQQRHLVERMGSFAQ